MRKENKPIDLTTEEIWFVSTFKQFEDEASGDKPYTIRDLKKMTAGKYDKIIKFLRGDINLMVIISKGYTKERIVNLCTHAMKWKDDIILAWKPNEGMYEK